MRTKNLDLRHYGVNPAKGRAYENIVYTLALIYNAFQSRVEAYFAPFGLTTVQFNVLMLAAYQNDGKGLKQVELSKRLIASVSNITKVVDKSVRAGLLSRKANPYSRRENIICITPQGRQLIDAVWPGYDDLVRGMTEKIPSKARRQTEQILQQWLQDLQETR